MHEGPQPLPTNINNDDEQCPSSGASPNKSTGPGADKARLLPTALAGPAQQGREPCPIILPRIAIGVSVAPHVPALPAARASVATPLALEHRPTLVLPPATNEGKGQHPGPHEPPPEEAASAN